MGKKIHAVKAAVARELLDEFSPETQVLVLFGLLTPDVPPELHVHRCRPTRSRRRGRGPGH